MGEWCSSTPPLPSNETLNETKETDKGYSGRGGPEMKMEKSKPTKKITGECGYRDIGERCLGAVYSSRLQLARQCSREELLQPRYSTTHVKLTLALLRVCYLVSLVGL
jgi:hypothetical protein